MRKLFLALSLFVASLSVTAQELDMMAVIPNDTEVRQGVLDNGATYYIRRNTKDPERANFHILYKVGAVLENDAQDGLAHFLEHMAFNGSVNFEGNGLIEYCQSNGIEFGANLNAATGQEQTTYMITDVPIVREGIVDSMLLVLHDWAGFISLNEADIDDERGVISEEWRMGEADANRRMQRKALDLVFGEESIFTQRDVIGPIKNIQNFPYDAIHSFYEKWYRPDLQAFVIVGDIDPEVIEAKLKKVMSNVKMPENPASKPKLKFDGNKEPRFGVFTDPELSSNTVTLYCKRKPMSQKYNNTVMAAKTELLNSMATSMIDDRMTEIAKKAGSPFVYAGTYSGAMSSTMDLLIMQAAAREGETLAAFEAGYTELLRAVRGGYAEPEVDRAKTKMLSNIERQYNTRNDRKNGQFVDDFTENFFNNEPYASAETLYELGKQLVESVTVDELNAQIASLLTDNNITVVAQIQEKEGVAIPTKAELQASYEKVNASEIEPYTEEFVSRPFLDEAALKGSAVAKTKEGKFETTVWTLKNGLKVVVKPTDLAEDEILFRASRKGGTSKIDDLNELYSIQLLSSFDQYCGISDFTSTEMNRAITGKKFSMVPYLGSNTEGFTGSSNKEDLETMLQFMYLYSTAPRMEGEDWHVMMDMLHTQVNGSKNNPMRVLQDTIPAVMFNNNPRQLTMGDKFLSEVSLDAYKTAYNKIFSNVHDMTFFITGSVDLETLKPLVEKYIGSLPVKKGPKAKVGKYIDEMATGDIVVDYTVKQEQPTVVALFLRHGKIKYSLKEALNLEIAGDVLSTIYLRTIREEAGGVYGINANVGVQHSPEPMFVAQTFFTTDPAKIEELIPLVQAGVDDLVQNGPSEENLNKSRLAKHKNFKNGLRSNSQWLGNAELWYIWGIDNNSIYEKTLDEVTVESVREAAERAFTNGNRLEIIQRP